MTVRKIRLCDTIKNADEYGYSPSDDFYQKTGLFLAANRIDFRPLVMDEQIVGLLIINLRQAESPRFQGGLRIESNGRGC